MWKWLKPIRLGFNMLSCAVFFSWADVKPRETISGLFGRKVATGSPGSVKGFWVAGILLIDAVHPDEPGHCIETFQVEQASRRVLGYDE